MQIRCDLHVNGGHRKLVLTSRPEEPPDHVALRLAAFLLFWEYDPYAELSPKHPALAGQEFRPDLIALNEAGELALWVECGNTSINKLDKLSRRYSQARLLVLKGSREEGLRQREDLKEQVARQEKIEVLAWPRDEFNVWRKAVREATHVVGEAGQKSFNLVINETPVAADLVSY